MVSQDLWADQFQTGGLPGLVHQSQDIQDLLSNRSVRFVSEIEKVSAQLLHGAEKSDIQEVRRQIAIWFATDLDPNSPLVVTDRRALWRCLTPIPALLHADRVTGKLDRHAANILDIFGFVVVERMMAMGGQQDEEPLMPQIVNVRNAGP